MAVLTAQRPTNEVLKARLGARTHLEYTWAHAVKVHTVPPCEVRRGAPAPSPAVRAEGPTLGWSHWEMGAEVGGLQGSEATGELSLRVSR